ncbi:MAG: conjugal transfer protein TraF [Nitrospinae bacterium]|nr:conjugal transfer protein TraF [Nitrospinota bacterium]
MKKMMLALCAVTAIGAVPAGASEMDKLYSGVRPFGMGNAFAAVADDENAAFYNPAGLTYVEEGRVELINPKIDVSTNTLDFQKDASDLKTGDTVAAVDMMRKYIGKHQHLAVDLFPNYTRHNFEIGVLGKVVLDAEVNSPSFPVLQADLKNDVGIVVALGHSFMEDQLRMGVTLKYIQRKRFYKEYTAVDFANSNTSYNFNDNLKSASKFGADVGVTYQFENKDWKPRVALVIQNIGDMNFGDYQATATSPVIPNAIKQQINLGAAVTRDIWIAKATLAADYNDAAGNVGTDKDKGKRLHMGAEIKFPKILALRVGLNQGYMSYGAGLDFWLLKLDYAYYTEEVGAYAGQREDARHALELSIGF